MPGLGRHGRDFVSYASPAHTFVSEFVTMRVDAIVIDVLFTWICVPGRAPCLLHFQGAPGSGVMDAMSIQGVLPVSCFPGRAWHPAARGAPEVDRHGRDLHRQRAPCAGTRPWTCP